MRLFALAVWLGAGTLSVAAAQTPTPTPNGEFLCTVAGGASPDGKACNSDDDCVPNGVCVIAQPVCNGGADDGAYCGCIGTNCVATSPACDPSFTGVCPSGPNAQECCDVASNCTGGAPCVGAQKVCLGGDYKAASCLNDGQCPGSVCRSTGKFCSGGDADAYACVDDSDCTGTAPTANGTCESATVSTPTAVPTATKTTPIATRTATPTGTARTATPTGATRTATPTGTTGTVGPTATLTPTSIPTSGTVLPSATPTPTLPVEIAARLTRAISASDLKIPVDDAGLLPSSGTVQIDVELISYLGKANNVLTGVHRGVPPTTAAPHAFGAVVLLVPGEASPTPAKTANITSVQVTGKGSGCSLADTTGSASGLGIMGAALACAAWRRARARWRAGH